MPTRSDKDDQIRKLAHVLCDEADAACIEIGVAEEKDLVPFDKLTSEQKAVYEAMARRIYSRLVYHILGGYIIVLPKEGDRLK